MNGKTYFWKRLQREERTARWPVLLRLAEARLAAELRDIYGR